MGVAACGPSAKQVILDCEGRVRPGVPWQDTYTVDVPRNRYCEANCGRIRSVQGSKVTIDLNGDHTHPTVIDLESGAITAWSREPGDDPEWAQDRGRCKRVNKSRYTRYD